ncbi:hypothetical protein MOMA_08461 [Moraxella macacae 0408225]|uniref:Uncharacterized protein n=1 Tax=Moraxella macacae 0408225 TaxID=1230338 RepID=L2F6S1_9GAMM|nr:Cro/CI family transcriptional regulator [Moraxella macacae]ELA08580.1 hypothetical protein MOMA_08461 [Moraxella macacae 0408225]
MKEKNHEIAKLIQFFGNQNITSKALGVSQSAIRQWLNKKTKIERYFAILAEKATDGEIKAIHQ